MPNWWTHKYQVYLVYYAAGFCLLIFLAGVFRTYSLADFFVDLFFLPLVVFFWWEMINHAYKKNKERSQSISKIKETMAKHDKKIHWDWQALLDITDKKDDV